MPELTQGQQYHDALTLPDTSPLFLLTVQTDEQTLTRKIVRH